MGTQVHYSGWPSVMERLRSVASGSGLLLDDNADARFSHKTLDQPCREPWVGIFHRPVKIDSLLPKDRAHILRQLEKHPHWPESRTYLRGAIALCDDVGVALRSWLQIPVMSILFPTEFKVPRWNAAKAFAERRLVHAGFTFRNTRMIFQIAPPGWQRLQLAGTRRRHEVRDQSLAELQIRPEVRREEVKIVRRVRNDMYDQLLTSSVVVNELYGAAANNLVVECLARGTPIVVNRLPAVEEYLGSRYPLFYSSLDDIEPLLTEDRLLSAHEHLLERSRSLPSFEGFAREVSDFVAGLEE